MGIWGSAWPPAARFCGRAPHGPKKPPAPVLEVAHQPTKRERTFGQAFIRHACLKLR